MIEVIAGIKDTREIKVFPSEVFFTRTLDEVIQKNTKWVKINSRVWVTILLNNKLVWSAYWTNYGLVIRRFK